MKLVLNSGTNNSRHMFLIVINSEVLCAHVKDGVGWLSLDKNKALSLSSYLFIIIKSNQYCSDTCIK